MKIAIFGGAFDPPHLGHMNLVKSFRDSINPDKVIIIPTGNAPHKSTMTPFEIRFKLAQAAFPDCEISDIENTPRTSYTIDTIGELRKIYPNDDFFLLIGSDMLTGFDRWKDYKRILEQCTVTAAARDGSEMSEYAKHAERLGIDFIEFPIIEMSSTQIRERYKPKRYIHSLNVAIMCGMLAKRHGAGIEASEKAYIAGLLHDIMKALPHEEAQDIVQKSDLSPDPVEIDAPKLWHAIAGAQYVRDTLKITDVEIINAIRFHTIARAGMSVVEKIVYLADKISFERDFDDVGEVRAAAFEDLDLGVYEAIKVGMEKTLEKCGQIPAYTYEAYNYYKQNDYI